MAAHPKDPGPEMDMDFGDAPTAPAAKRTPPEAFASDRVHPSDAEWVSAKPEPPRRPQVNGHKNERLGRELPHSFEMEEHLLSCCFLDGADVVARCIEAKISPDSFYNKNSGAIFEAILSLHYRKIPIEVATVAEELRDARRLDELGGYKFLISVSGQLPTTAQAGFYIDKVREQALLRELIRAATAAVEDTYNYSGDLKEFVETQRDRLKRVLDGASIADGDKIAARAFDIKRQIKKPDAIFSLASTTVSTPGNLTAIYSQAKTGKSSTIGAMISAAMSNPTSGHDTLGFVGPNYSKKALLHFDTEQSPYDWQQLITSSLRRVNLAEPPSWLMSYTLTGMSASDCREFIKATIKRAVRIHGGVHSIFIDGIADLVIDPNDPAECFPLVTELHATAIEHNTAVICILHMNPGSEAKGRGHLGSQLERKAESNLTLEKEGEITRVWGVKQRGKAIEKDKAPCFKWSDEHMMHRTCATPGVSAQPKRDVTDKYSFSEFKNSFPERGDPAKPLPEILRTAAASVPINMTVFYALAQRFVREGLIEEFDVKGQKKTYRQIV